MSVDHDLRAALIICRDLLVEADAHPINIARVKLIWTIVQWAIEANPHRWQAALDQVERIVDAQAPQKVR